MSAFSILLLMGSYFALLVALSWLVGRTSGHQSFYHGDRKSPWYVVAFGMIGATISGVTYISVPGEVGNSSFHYLQFVFGNLIGYLVIAIVLLPYYYRNNVISIYSVVRNKMGESGYLTSSGFFIVSKLIGAGFRLYLVTLVLQMAVSDQLKIPFYLTVLVCLLVIWLYTFKSGIKTVVWSDTLQTLLLLASVITSVCILTHQSGIDFRSVVRLIGTSAETRIFDWEWHSSNFFPKQLVAGIFMTLAMNGFDQDIIQKNLTCKSAAQARKNMIWFSIGFVVVVFLFLVLGAMLYRYASINSISLPSKSDQLFPVIALNYMGPVAAALFILGITAAAFSSADSASTALTTAVCVDFIKIERFGWFGQHRLRLLVHALISFLLFGIILLFHSFNDQSVVVSIFTAAGYTYGPILGIFAFLFFVPGNPARWSILPVALASPVLTWLISAGCSHYLGYHFGFEIIVLNGFLTFAGLILCSFGNRTVKKV